MSVRRAPTVLLALALALAGVQLTSCAGTPTVVSLGPPTEQYTYEDYHDLLERWTRHDSVLLVKSLENTLKVYATFLSPDFAAAYVARRAHTYKLTEPERAKLRQELKQEEEASYTFFVAAATHEPSWNDFTHKKSLWHISLINDAKEELRPQKVDAKKKIDTDIKEFFPYAGTFYRAYTISFPKVLPDGRPLVRPETKQLTLRFAGPLGVAKLSWRLQ